MPLKIDPHWEYYVPDPEIAEIFAENAAHGFDGLREGRLDKENFLGLRFGRGNPNYCKFKLRPAKQLTREPAEVVWKECLLCGKWYETLRPRRQKFCSIVCAKQHLHAGNCTISMRLCETCGTPFKPRQAESRFCCIPCGALARIQDAPTYPPGTCQNCGGVVPPSCSRNQKQARKYCGPVCKIAVTRRNARIKKRATRKLESG